MEKEKDSSVHQRGLRLSKLHADELVNLYSTHTRSESYRSNDLLCINCAHTLMLQETGIITAKDAVKILECLRAIEKNGIDRLISVNPRAGDLSTHMEAYIIRETGAEVGGKIHTGRSRNDLYPTLTKMLVRRFALNVYEALAVLNRTLLSMALDHRKTILPGYTHHSQHAQPITLGFFLLGNFDVFNRDLQRIENLWDRLNTCPMGAAALATTGFPLNRKRMAELLGFRGVHEHAYDAVSAKDFLLEYLFVLAAVVSDLGRIAENILHWNTFECGMVTLSDEYTSFSTIMPQKKNPVAIETIRAFNAIITGKLTNAFGILKGEPWSNGRETTILDDDCVDTGRQVQDLVHLFNGVIRTMEIHSDRMYDLTCRGFSASTELADALVRDFGFPFRTAHEIVGLTVKRAVDRGLDSTQISAEMVAESISEHTGTPADIDPGWVRKALDPRENVERRSLPGGPAYSEVTRMIEMREAVQKQNEAFLAGCRTLLEKSENLLRGAVDDLLEKKIP